MKSVAQPKRRPYVKDPDMCRTCRHGLNGCPAAKHMGKGVCACISYFPAMEQV